VGSPELWRGDEGFHSRRTTAAAGGAGGQQQRSAAGESLMPMGSDWYLKTKKQHASHVFFL
jgi:hypothetical protein